MLWVDVPSSCGYQITMMAKIFTHPVKDLFWLAESYSDAEKAHNTIERILENARLETNNFETLLRTSIDEMTVTYRYFVTGLNIQVDFQVLEDFTNNDWFRRPWVCRIYYPSSIADPALPNSIQSVIIVREKFLHKNSNVFSIPIELLRQTPLTLLSVPSFDTLPLPPCLFMLKISIRLRKKLLYAKKVFVSWATTQVTF